MSVPPTAVIVYAGTWNSTTEYFQYYGVVSPIDNGFYVYVGDVPITGGNDPSEQLDPIWVQLQGQGGGDITGVIAGLGLSGGGSIGTVTLTNEGVRVLTAGTGGVSLSGTAQDPTVNIDTVTSLQDLKGVVTFGSNDDSVNINTNEDTKLIDLTVNFPAPPPQVPIAFGTAFILGETSTTVFYIPTGVPKNTYTIDAPVECLLQQPDGATQNWIVYSRPYNGPTLQYIEVGFAQPVTEGGLILVSWSVLAVDSTPVEATSVPI
jgi:hypothetical protein